MEICEIARNAADLMVEARKASDLYNLLAYPVLKFAGGFLTNLDGSFLDNEIIDTYKQYDYIAVNNQILLEKTVNVLNDFTTAKKYEYENVKIEI
jgi:fructose-1,6-bisphosphatase/inositol monophosphatase family enzyme